jgi:hypothetical protein
VVYVFELAGPRVLVGTRGDFTLHRQGSRQAPRFKSLNLVCSGAANLEAPHRRWGRRPQAKLRPWAEFTIVGESQSVPQVQVRVHKSKHTGYPTHKASGVLSDLVVREELMAQVDSLAPRTKTPNRSGREGQRTYLIA